MNKAHSSLPPTCQNKTQLQTVLNYQFEARWEFRVYLSEVVFLDIPAFSVQKICE